MSPADLPKPKRIGGMLRDFIIKNGLDQSYCLTEKEEAERREKMKEAERKRRKKSITLTVGTVEAIDAEVKRLEDLGLYGLASRDKIVGAAMAVLVNQAIGASSRRI